MGVYRFEDLRVWQAARIQCDRVGELIKRVESRQDPELAAQMNGAAVSVATNIAEGFLRHHDREFRQFLRISIASNGEVKACYYAAAGRSHIPGAETDRLIEENERIARMLRRPKSTLKR